MKSLLKKSLLAAASFAALSGVAQAGGTVTQIGKVWIITMENRNFAQPSNDGYGPQIYGNTTDAPYINKLIGFQGATAPLVNTYTNPVTGIPATITLAQSPTSQVSWSSSYHHVLSQPAGSGANTLSVHPSEPNYLWGEAGSNFGILNDNDPYQVSGPSVPAIQSFVSANPQYTIQSLRTILQNAGISWRSYQEGIDLQDKSGGDYNQTRTSNGLTNTVVAPGSRTVPFTSFSGTSTSYINPYNGSHQYNFATKHEGSLFFPATNGSTTTTANTSTSNPMAANYVPLEQLATDLANGTAARYNWITPDQYNDMHTALSSTFTYVGNGNATYTGAHAQIAQGDNFLSIVVPQIMASSDYQNGGAIIIWTDETETSLTGGNNGGLGNDFGHTLMEIVISPLTKGNAYKSTVNLTHSSDLNTMQKIFQVAANTPTGYLNDAANPSYATGGATPAVSLDGQGLPLIGYGSAIASDLSDLFQAGVIPTSIPVAKITQSGYAYNARTKVYTQTVTVTNNLATAISTPVYLVVDNLSSNTSVKNAAGTVSDPANTPIGGSYVLVSGTGLAVGASATVTLQFAAPTSGTISDSLRVITTTTQP